MKLHAVKLGVAVAIVAAILAALMIPFAAYSPHGVMRGGYGWMHGGYMMRGGPAGVGYGHMYGWGWGGVAAGVVICPIVAGLAAWATAAIYNRLVGGGNSNESADRLSD